MVCLATVVRTRMWVWLHPMRSLRFGPACSVTVSRSVVPTFGSACVVASRCAVLQSGGYGGQAYLCADTASMTVQGMYSEIGYMRGLRVGNNLVGQWFEAGGGMYGGGWHWGNFSLRLAPNGVRFTGIWNYAAAPSDWQPWEESRVSSASPTPSQCFTSTLTNPPCTLPPGSCAVALRARADGCAVLPLNHGADGGMAGAWQLSTGLLVDTCSAGNGATWMQSQVSGTMAGPMAGTTTSQQASCFLGGTVCTGSVRVELGLLTPRSPHTDVPPAPHRACSYSSLRSASQSR